MFGEAVRSVNVVAAGPPVLPTGRSVPVDGVADDPDIVARGIPVEGHWTGGHRRHGQAAWDARGRVVTRCGDELVGSDVAAVALGAGDATLVGSCRHSRGWRTGWRQRRGCPRAGPWFGSTHRSKPGRRV